MKKKLMLKENNKIEFDMQMIKTFENEIYENPDGKLLQRYTLDNIIFSGDLVSIFQGHENDSRQRSVFYISNKLKKDCQRFINEFSTFSRLRIYRLPVYDIIQEAYFETNLNDFLNTTSQGVLDEEKIIEIFTGLFTNLKEFKEKEFLFANISLNSIVYQKGVWKFDLATAILDLYKYNKIFYPFKEVNERTEVYALGVVLFTCLFGFYPFTNKTPDIFKVKNYLECLNEKSPQDCSKIVVFLRSKLKLSSEATNILERSLSITRQMSLDEFISHPFFTKQRNQQINNNSNHNIDIKILNDLEPKQVSKVLVAMEKYKVQPVPIRRENLLASGHIRTADNVIDFLRHDNMLSRFQINESFRVLQPVYYSQNNSPLEFKNPPLLKLKYFNREVTDLDDEYPSRELIKYIDESRHNYGHDPQRQALLLRYAYPYTVAFQLLKVQYKQSPDIQQKIDAAVEILLVVSNLNYAQTRPPIPQLHQLQIINESFDFIKPKYREILHHLYKHFLNMAIYKYNTAKKQLISNPDYQGASFLKEEGLNAYRLCWKLLEASLIVRKQGKELDLGHIETSERKEIEIGINNLLSKYFPNKIA